MRDMIDLYATTPAERTRLIIARVAENTGIPLDAILGPRRTKAVCRARDQAVWELRQKTRLSLPQIGRVFTRDHTTAINSIRNHEARMNNGTYKKARGRSVSREAAAAE